jgi:pimeloyl-ACP methyl ester carboxylesterase
MTELFRFEVRRGDVVLSGLRGGAGGDPVVLLPGLAGTALELAPTAAALVPEHQVLVLDLRGHGFSTRRPADLSRQAFVDDVLAVIDASVPGEPVTLVGQSMGAQTAMMVAAARPETVRGLVMLEGGVGGSTEDYPTELGKWFRSWPVPFAEPADAVRFLGGGPMAEAWGRDLESRADGWWPRFDPDVMETTIRGVADVARWDEWQRITAPTLLVFGGRNKRDEAELRRMIELRPDVEQATIADAGHDAHLDQPAAWLAVLRDFLDRTATARRG